MQHSTYSLAAQSKFISRHSANQHRYYTAFNLTITQATTNCHLSRHNVLPACFGLSVAREASKNKYNNSSCSYSCAYVEPNYNFFVKIVTIFKTQTNYEYFSHIYIFFTFHVNICPSLLVHSDPPRCKHLPTWHGQFPILKTTYSNRFSRQTFIKVPNTKFHENPSSGSRDNICGQTDGYDEANRCF
jgi:hypothetical protein